MLKRLKIERLRGISALELDDLCAVNVFIGENGCGKTTVLEAICLAARANQPGTVGTLGAWRELPPLSLASDSAIATLFFRADFENGPRLEFQYGGKNHLLQITQLAETGYSSIPVAEQGSGFSSGDETWAARPLRGISYELSVEPDQSYKSRFILQAPPVNLAQIDGAPFHNEMGCFYIQARRATSIQETANVLTTLSKRGHGDRITNALSFFDSRVRTIEAGVQGNMPEVLVDLGYPEKLPINVMGDGFCRTALILTGLCLPRPAIVAVDEVDSGLHITKMRRFWETVCKLGQEYDRQVFCTTRNEEMLLHTLEAFKNQPEKLRIYRIDRLDDGTSAATKYTYADYQAAQLASVDIR
jgi:energy-coupling factor transporter ATP-binding protein EcfA2